MTKATEPGVDIDVTIDDVSYRLPHELDPGSTLRQTVQTTGNGAYRIDVPYDGDGLPDQPDLFEFVLSYDLDDNTPALVAALEDLRTSGGAHTFAFWKKKKYRYTAQQAQQVFYLPRPDAYTKNYSGHNTLANDGAVITVNNVGVTVDYPGVEVTAASVVTAGHVAISAVAVQHPNSGRTVALYKFGTGLNVFDIVRVEYHPLFNVGVRDVTDQPYRMVGREDKTVRLVEVN